MFRWCLLFCNLYVFVRIHGFGTQRRPGFQCVRNVAGTFRSQRAKQRLCVMWSFGHGTFVSRGSGKILNKDQQSPWGWTVDGYATSRSNWHLGSVWGGSSPFSLQHIVLFCWDTEITMISNYNQYMYTIVYTYIYRYVLCYKFFSLGHFQDYQVAYLLSLLRCLLWCSGMLPALLWREYEASPSGLRQALQVPAPRCSMDVEPLPQRSRPKLQSLQFLQSLHSCMLLQKLTLSQLENH